MVEIRPLRIDVDREQDGRMLAAAPDLPAGMAYGQSQEQATRKRKAIALEVSFYPLRRRFPCERNGANS